MSKVLTWQDCPELGQMTAEYLAPYIVGFVKIRQPAQDDAFLAGSGTLIQVEERFGILTADHVIAELPRSGQLGLVLPKGPIPQLDRHTVTADHVKFVQVAPASFSSLGPDLGYLLLPEPERLKLEVHKIFYSLSKRRAEMLAAPRPIDYGGWCITGMVDEWTRDLAPKRGYRRVKGFHGFCGLGVVNSERSDDHIDYLNFETKFDEAYEGPGNFQGVSGGGLWQVIYEERNGIISIRDALLSGVVFYQTEIQSGITLSCHGRRSIYQNVHDSIGHM